MKKHTLKTVCPNCNTPLEFNVKLIRFGKVGKGKVDCPTCKGTWTLQFDIPDNLEKQNVTWRLV